MSRVLAEHGIKVSGVDESAEMLAHLPTEVEGFCSSIETLTLDRRWPVVLLASNLINHPDPTARQSLVEAAFRHASPEGDLYVQRYDVDWLASAVPGKVGQFAGIVVYTESIHREWPYVTMTLRYEASGNVWRQHFTAEALCSGQVESVLYEVGFDDVRWYGESRSWARARKCGV